MEGSRFQFFLLPFLNLEGGCMSKLYSKYLELKSIDENKMYLFESGKFYVFIDEDAKNINKITTLKLTNLTNDIVKCGFPSNSLNKYYKMKNQIQNI